MTQIARRHRLVGEVVAPRIGQIVLVRVGTYTVRNRCAAIVTKVHGETSVDLTVFPGDGVAPFAMKAVRRAAADDRELSSKERFYPIAE